MAWNNLIGLDKEKRLFQTAMLTNRLASAYCFVGMEGIGKDGFAIELAKTANCYNPIKSVQTGIDDITHDTITACDECKSCQMANNFAHPNIQYVFATPNKDKITEAVYSEIKAQIAIKKSNIYHKIVLEKANEIQVDTIRNINKNNALANDIGHRFIIISDGDKLNDKAANAFLKTLEEPANNTTIIITTSKKERLLNTILSRCQQISFNSLTTDAVAGYLIEQYHCSEVDSKLFATLSQGSITKAVAYFDENINAMRSQVVDILRITLKKKIFRIELINAIEEIAKKDRGIINILLNLLLIWMRDVLAIAMAGDNTQIVNIDLKERIIKFNSGFPDADIFQAIEIIEDAIDKLHSNVDLKLLLLSTFISMRAVFLK